MADLVGQQLGNYRLIQLVGRGGFSEVYLGEHVFLKTRVAVKVRHEEFSQDLLKDFLNEARIIAGLQHPNIVRVFDFGENNGRPFLVMDYAPHGNLRERHPKGSRIPLADIVSYVKQVAAALHYAHEKKLIHRDVKPANMLLGATNQILLSDFGIASVSHNEQSVLTQEVAGTVPYIAPEQIRGRPHHASDQYSLGIVVYEWLCGSRPFQGTQWEIMQQHISAPPAPLREKVPSISPAVEMVVLTALAKEPQQRFANILAFASALERAYQLEQFTRATSPISPEDLDKHAPTLQPTSLSSTNIDSASNRSVSVSYDVEKYPTVVIPPMLSDNPYSTEIAPPDNPYSTVVARPDNPNAVESILPEELHPLPVSVSSTAKCPFCSSDLRPEDFFCLNCGGRVHPVSSIAILNDKGQQPSILGSLLEPTPSFLDPGMNVPAVPSASQLIEPGVEDNVVPSAEKNLPIPLTELTLEHEQIKASLIEEGNTHYKARRYKEALVAYERVIQLDVQNVSAYVGKGNTLLECEQYDEALLTYDTALRFVSTDASIWTSKGYVLAKLVRYSEALEAYKNAILYDPQAGLAYVYTGHVLLLQRKYKGALAEYEKVLDFNPDYVVALIAKGNVLYKLKQYKKALASYERATVLAPDNAPIWITKGNILAKLKHYDDAGAAYDKALALTPDAVGLWLAKGKALTEQKHYDKALEVYNHILSITPDDVAIIVIKGNLLSELGHHDDALSAYDHALMLLPRRASIWQSRGKLLSKLERYEEALESYERALAYKPNDTSISDQCIFLRRLKRQREELERANLQESQMYQAPDTDNQPAQRSDYGQTIRVKSKQQEYGETLHQTNMFTHYDVFLSYSHENPTDVEWVERLAGRLQDEERFHIWLDKWVLVAGQSWQQAKARGLESAGCCVVCIGEQTSSGWFEQEIQRAKNRQAKDPTFAVIPVLLPTAKNVNIDNFLELNTLVNFRDDNHAHAFHVLVCGVKGMAPGRWSPSERSITLSGTITEGKLRELEVFRREKLIDDSVAVEFQKTVLE